MELPFKATTRAGSVVTITGYYTGYDRPWVGILDIDLVDAHIPWACSWLEEGFYLSKDKERALDLIDLPKQFIEVPE